MTQGTFRKGPNIIHPEESSAVGSRNSAYRDGRDEYKEARIIIDEEVDKVLNHVTAKLPPEVLEKLHVGGNVKEVLHNYYNQGLQNMFNRYLVTTEDEMAKKFRDLVDEQEYNNSKGYAPKDIGNLINTISSREKFNNAVLEQSIVNVYGNLQDHLEDGISRLEGSTLKLLNEKCDIGALLNSQHSSSILKCNFSDNPLKAETVSDVTLILNVVESELIEPIYHYQVASEVIIRNVLSEHILNVVNKEVEDYNSELMDQKLKGLNRSNKVFETFKKLEENIGFEDETADSKQFSYIAKRIIDAIQGIEAEIDLVDFDPLNVRENVQRVLDDENIRNRGYNTAVNALISILDTSNLGYQHIENFKNCRKTLIREYADVNQHELPDENYSLTLTFRDDLQLREERIAYCQQMDEFEAETNKLVRVFDRIQEEEKAEQGFLDYEDIANEIFSEGKKKKQESVEFERNKNISIWDEISFILPEKDDIEKLSETFIVQRRILKKKFSSLRKQTSLLFKYDYPQERIILEQRLDFLEEKFDQFCQQFNPFQAHPGLFLEFLASSIKRRETTVIAMSNVISQFLAKISTGFTDSSFDEYHRNKAELSSSSNNQQFAAAI